ncbi:hypothetical protein [Rheinheimera maricola]|uniref:CopL family metal-binding regulatory protein n=1 Tax=Rheinheimera maricola TaxID=2793282 RepID=A0ABS7X6T6_9GAMM|nr:hypothetical protein [Rheinheimera maricola]MBZ9611259.1 hypothetical protein [Rheinheimera maricola]
MLVSYLLLITLALSGFSGSVQTAHAYTLADALSKHSTQQQAANSATEMPCHSAAKVAPVETEHDCCEQPQHQCKSDCCAKHCATTGALLATELFRYIRPNTTVAQHIATLPQWFFAEDPPPPINA